MAANFECQRLHHSQPDTSVAETDKGADTRHPPLQLYDSVGFAQLGAGFSSELGEFLLHGQGRDPTDNYESLACGSTNASDAGFLQSVAQAVGCQASQAAGATLTLKAALDRPLQPPHAPALDAAPVGQAQLQQQQQQQQQPPEWPAASGADAASLPSETPSSLDSLVFDAEAAGGSLATPGESSTLTRAPASCGSGSDAAPSGDTRGSGVAAANAVCGPRLASAAASGCSASLLQSDLTATAAQAAASDSGVPSRPPEGERRMKRRLANRESTQRVRQRRRLQFDDMQAKLTSMMGETQRLVARITQAEADRNETAGQLAALQAQLAAEQAAKAELQASLKADAARLGRQMAGAGAAGGSTAQTSGSAASVSTALASVSTALASASTGFAAGWRGAAPSGQSLGYPHGGAAVAANTAVAPPPLAPPGGFAAAIISGFPVQSSCPNMAAQWRGVGGGYGTAITSTPANAGPPVLQLRNHNCRIVSSGHVMPPPRNSVAPGDAALAASDPMHPQRLRQRAAAAATSAHARIAGQMSQRAARSRQAAAAAASTAATAVAAMPVPTAAPTAASMPAASPFAADSLTPFD